MFSFQWLNVLRGKGGPSASENRPRTRPTLESLEDRITPTTFATYTNATVQIIPNLFTFTVTEKVTANVSVNGTIDPSTGAFTPGSGPAVSTGHVLFNLNNQQQSVAVNGGGQANATFTIPLVALFAGQALEAHYQPLVSTPPPTDVFVASEFLAPLYTNFDNLVFAATLTFGTLSRQQQTGVTNSSGVVVLPSFYTAQGESDSLLTLVFKYNDPGVITTFSNFGINLPGFLAAVVGAYGPEFIP
jgi:hypothetical protein